MAGPGAASLLLIVNIITVSTAAVVEGIKGNHETRGSTMEKAKEFLQAYGVDDDTFENAKQYLRDGFADPDIIIETAKSVQKTAQTVQETVGIVRERAKNVIDGKISLMIPALAVMKERLQKTLERNRRLASFVNTGDILTFASNIASDISTSVNNDIDTIGDDLKKPGPLPAIVTTIVNRTRVNIKVFVDALVTFLLLTITTVTKVVIKVMLLDFWPFNLLE
jgi:hypothetical protein